MKPFHMNYFATPAQVSVCTFFIRTLARTLTQATACTFFIRTLARTLTQATACALLFTLFSFTSAFSQPPNGFNYQAVLRDASGAVKAGSSVSVIFSILQGSADGTVVFTETHNTTTSSMGLINLEIGSVNTDDFMTVDWSAGSYFLKIEVDGTEIGTSQLLSVPYAMHAKTVEIDKVEDADADPANEIQTLNLNGNDLTLSKGGGTITLPTAGANDNWGTQAVVTEASLSGNGTSASPLKIAQRSATSGQVLKWNGTYWAPSADETGEAFDLPYSGEGALDHRLFWIKNTGGGAAIYGEVTVDDAMGVFGMGTTLGIQGQVTNSHGKGISGDAFGSDSYGVYGQAMESNSAGVYGIGSGSGVYGTSSSAAGKGTTGKATSASGVNYGIYGSAVSPDGYGVYGSAPAYGVYGISSSNGGRAVMGEASGAASIGIYGEGLTTGSYGVCGMGANHGVHGETFSNTGSGVYGSHNPSSGIGYGVQGITYSTSGRAIYGTAESSTGGCYGVYGKSVSSAGVGVYGSSTATSGDTRGVLGTASSNAGYGVCGAAPVYGVYGIANNGGGRAVTGEANANASIGVMGIALDDNSTGVWGEGALYDFYAAGPGTNYGSGSSIRWKRNITPIPQPLEKIRAIRGVYFDWDEAHGGNHDVGMIAEEVGKVLPEIVVYEENGADASGMDYSKTTPLLVEGIKALLDEIGLLKAENEKLKERITSIESRIGDVTGEE